MKRIAIALAFTLLIASFAAQAGEKYRVAYVLKALNSEFWQSVKNGADAAAKDNPDMQLVVLAPDSEVNVQQQVQIVEDVLAQGVDALVIAPCGAVELNSTMQKAVDAGIPVIISDTDANFPPKKTFVGTNNIVGGKLAGEFIVKKLGGKGKVAIIAGIMGHQTAMDRVKGAKDVFDATPGIEVVSVQTANWERALAMSVAENILSANPDLDAIFCCNDLMAMGALEAVASEKSKALVVGFDANDEAVKSVADGVLAATVAQSSFNIGKFSVEAGLKAAKKQEISNRIDTGTELVTKENAAKFLKK